MQQSHFRVYNQENQNMYLHKNEYMNVHSRIIHKSQKVEITQCLWTGEQTNNMWYIHTM